MEGLNRIVAMYLDYGENQENNGIVMYMKDRVEKLDASLNSLEKQSWDIRVRLFIK